MIKIPIKFEVFTILLFIGILILLIIADDLLRLGCYKLFIQSGQHFVLLAESFLNGKLYFLQMDKMGLVDLVKVNGHYYWPLEPFPSILIIPFVLLSKVIGFQFYQGHLHIFIIAGIFWLCYRLGLKFRFSISDSLFLAFAFCFSSTFLYIVLDSRAWYFSHAISVFFAFLSLHEYYKNKKRWFLIGIFTGFLFATRFTSGLIVLFFILIIGFSNHLARRVKLKSISKLLIPVAVILLLLGLYNKARFGSFFDTGYSRPIIFPESQRLMEETYGLFGLNNIITNFYWYFLAPLFPVVESGTYHLIFPYFYVNPVGLSLFITSPVFLLVLKKTWTTSEQKFIWITSLTILFVLLTFYASGYYQFGPRYFLDVLPLLYISLMYSFKKRKIYLHHKTLIIVSFLVNLYLITFSLGPV